jgi:peptidoglycan/xylan/chitin deacetylase (PgdA/CDA1 family)
MHKTLIDLYSKLRRKFSSKNQGRLTKLLVLLRLKPKVNLKVFSPFEKGIVVLSADFEMAWAFRYSKTQFYNAEQKGIEERNNIPILLKLFNKYKIPVTWATVGHLFLKECIKNGSNAHPEMPRPGFFENKNWKFDSGDWYQHDPCTNFELSPAWYASDLIDMIIESKIKHEIGSHTFSHIDFTYNNCTHNLALAELDECTRLAEKKGIKLKSMVFPGGTAGNYETLVEKGFTCYRKPMDYHIDLPYVDKYGLVAIPSSLELNKDPYGWSKSFHLKILKSYLDKTASSKLVCHFWFHPSMDIWYLNSILPDFLEMLTDYTNVGKVNILTMQELADIVINSPNYPKVIK